MKKLLLGTTALIAAGAFVGAAQAGDDEMMVGPVTVGIAGYTVGAIGFASDDMKKGKVPVPDEGTDMAGHVHSDGEMDVTHPLRGEEIFHVYEFVLSGSTTLDNGITVGVHTQLGSSGGDAIFDEQHITLSGAFGSLRIGRTESAAFNATVAAPGAGLGGSFGVNYAWYSPAAATVNTYSGLVEDAQKVVYTSPNFNGLTIGMSYAPDGSDDAAGAGRTTDDQETSKATGADIGQMSEHMALGVSYSTAFMDGGSMNIGLGYEVASNEAGGDAGEAMKVGASVSIDQISFGGGMYDNGKEDGMQFDVGASWSEGATELGLQYGGNQDGDTGMMALHLTYTLGPGVIIGGQIASGSGGAEDVTQILLGTSVGF